MDEEERYYYAIYANDYISLRRLLDNGADVNHVFTGLTETGDRPNVWSALHLCCERGHTECAQVLLERRADPDICDRWNWTPLFYSIQREWHDLVELLLRYNCDVNRLDRRGINPLHCCVDSCETEYCSRCMRTLLDHDVDVNVGDALGRTPLWMCASNDGHVDHIKILLESNKCLIDDVDVREKRTPLQSAIMHASRDRMQYVRLLLDAGCDVNSRDVRKHTSLMNVLWRTWSLGEAISQEDQEICKLILQHDYDVNSVSDKVNWLEYGGPTINMAVERGAFSVVKMLIQYGADPNVTDNHNNSSVMIATDNNKMNILALLVSYGANLDIEGNVTINEDRICLTPLRCAVYRERYDAAVLLAQAGCDLSNEEYLRNRDSPDINIHSEQFLCLNAMATSPRSLLMMCVRRIRYILGVKVREKAGSLMMPNYLEDVIKLTHVTSPWLDTDTDDTDSLSTL